MHFDIVHAADPRYLGGTASALRAEFAAAHHWGLKTALIPFLGPRSRVVSGFEPRLNRRLKEAGTPILNSDTLATCDVLFAHHPNVFEYLPHCPTAISAKRVVCVMHHPPFDGAHRAQFNINRVADTLEKTFNAPVSFAPISSVIRRQLGATDCAPNTILPVDFNNLIVDQEWPERHRPAPRNKAIIGRHSRADPLKWPDTPEIVTQAYPHEDQIEIQVLGDAVLPDEMNFPPNWTIHPFRENGVADFLAGLDFYVYFHSDKWVEAFGIAIAEAIASGVVTLLPRHFEPIFGEAAVYCSPQDVSKVVHYFLSRPDEYARQSREGRAHILLNHGLQSYGPRMAQVFEALNLKPPRSCLANVPAKRRAPAPATKSVPDRKRILMTAGNGIGLGHITRLMAVATHLPSWIDPVFLTLSLGTEIIRNNGFSADYIPSHSKSGVTSQSWNEAYAIELLAMIDSADIKMVVFDGNDAFPGMRRIMALRRDIKWVWIRRGLWQPHHSVNQDSIDLFDMVITPGEFAGFEDGGDTRDKGGVERVDPILLCDPDARATRKQAAKNLDVSLDRPVVALQLGSRQNFDVEALRTQIISRLQELQAHGEIHAIEIVNSLAPPDPDARLETRRLYPFFKHSRAIDLLISTPGYNTFHESIYGAIPSIFVPNEASEMDDQMLRAMVGQSAGQALALTVSDEPRVSEIIQKGLSTRFQKQVRARAKTHKWTNGAVDAAELIAHFLISVRTDLPMAETIRRQPSD